MASVAAGTWWTVPDSDDEDELLLDVTAGLGRDPTANKVRGAPCGPARRTP